MISSWSNAHVAQLVEQLHGKQIAHHQGNLVVNPE